MNQNVSITQMNIKGREFILAEVCRGMGQIGIFRYSSTMTTATDIFYIEREPILKIFDSKTNDETYNKSILQTSGSEKTSDFIQVRINAAIENYFYYSQGLVRSAIPVLELLTPGLYVMHESQMHPCDGNGGFFWNSYGVKRDIPGSADRNNNIGDGNYSPCFLVPTHQPSTFQAKQMYSFSDKCRDGEQLGGIAYHVSGMFSALLEGHHAATAALINDTEFKCLVIEPLTSVLYNTAEKNAKNRKIIALSCPYVKIPLEELPDNTLERFLISRRHIKPASFADLKVKMSKSIKTVSKKAFPANVYEKVEQLPDIAMVESAASVNSLSEEQIMALLAGKVKVSEEDTDYIISVNNYASLITAADYLQVSDSTRFLSFAIEILTNEDVSAAHKQIAERLLTIMHPIVYDFFDTIIENDPEGTGIITDTARKYVIKWKEYTQRRTNVEDNYHKAKKKRVDNMQAIAEAKGIHTLEAAVRTVADMPKSHGF
jgi:hypothetical protein